MSAKKVVEKLKDSNEVRHGKTRFSVPAHSGMNKAEFKKIYAKKFSEWEEVFKLIKGFD